MGLIIHSLDHAAENEHLLLKASNYEDDCTTYSRAVDKACKRYSLKGADALDDLETSYLLLAKTARLLSEKCRKYHAEKLASKKLTT
jgi:hypothetical protein